MSFDFFFFAYRFFDRLVSGRNEFIVAFSFVSAAMHNLVLAPSNLQFQWTESLSKHVRDTLFTTFVPVDCNVAP